MNIKQIPTLIAEDMAALNDRILQALHSDVALINQISHYLINSGGKRLRPQMVILSANACGYQGEQHIDLAAIIEFIHTATLLHDDVVDKSLLRRGAETANNVWGDSASVLVGDFVYSRSFQLMVKLNSMHIMDILADTTNIISEGEVMQLAFAQNPNTSEENYLDIIRCKTAALFQAACRLGAVISNLPDAIEAALSNFGLNLGIAYQMADDALDYNASAEQMGKNVGDDLAEGKPTLPLIHILQNGSAEQQQLVRHAIENKDASQLSQIKQAIDDTHALAYTYHVAKSYSDNAKQDLSVLPDSSYKEALLSLADFAVTRKR